MNVCLLNSHSSNNRNVFELSERNHRYYCERHNYDMLNMIKPYNRCLDFDLLKYLLLYYDVVAIMGSDLLFTDFDKKITDFQLGDITGALEASGNNVINGDFTIWKRSALYLIPTFQQTQQQCGDYQATLNACRQFIMIQPLQHAAGSLNPSIANNCWHPGDYSIHFHAIGYAPINSVKADAMQSFIKEHPELDKQ